MVVVEAANNNMEDGEEEGEVVISIEVVVKCTMEEDHHNNNITKGVPLHPNNNSIIDSNSPTEAKAVASCHLCREGLHRHNNDLAIMVVTVTHLPLMTNDKM
jgi:hypothetical protein